MLNTLTTRYSISNEPRTYQLWSALTNTKHDYASVMSYYTKFLGMWDDSLTSSPIEICGCEKRTKTATWHESLRAYQF